MHFLNQPRHVPQKIDSVAITQPVTRPIAMPVQLTLIDDRAERRRIQ
jgi:hypothetical protein